MASNAHQARPIAAPANRYTGLTQPAHLIFVDTSVTGWEALVADRPADALVIVLDAAFDGVRELARHAAALRDLEAIHIVSHGAPGEVRLGTARLSCATIEAYRQALTVVGRALRPGGDLLLYGCEVGRGACGAALVARMATLTGADVAASATKTGAAALGGGWDLSVRAGDVDAPLFASRETLAAYGGVLAVMFSNQADPLGDTGAFDARMVFGDFDNDGDIDVLYQNGNTAGAGFGYKQNNGSGVFTDFSDANASGSPFDTFDFTGQQLSGLFVVDYDNDGDADIIDRDSNGGLNAWRNAAGVFSLQADPLGDTGAFDSRMVFGDFDSDGDIDVLYQNGNTAGTGFGYKQNNGSGVFTDFSDANASGTPFDTFDFTGQQLSGLFVVDYDNDGDADIIDRDGNGGLSAWRNAAGVFSLQADPLGDTGAFDSRMVFGDFDSDGDIDVLYQNGNTAGTGFGYKQNNGSGVFTDFSDANASGTPFDTFDFTGQQLTGLFVVDYDNDGDVDIVDREGTLSGWVQGSNSGGDGSPPTLVSSNPADNATGVAVSASIAVTFDESVVKGTGNIEIVRVSDDTVVETIAVTSGQVTGAAATWTIDPSITLAASTEYAVRFGEGTFVDTDGAVFFGIVDNTTLSFTTGAANVAPSLGNLNGDTPAFTEEAGAVLLDESGNATVIDADSPDFDTGTLTVAITANRVGTEDVLGIQNQGAGPGQIGVSGSNVTFGGVTVGTFTGGTGINDLVVTFNANATPAAAQALLRNLTYNNTNTGNPSTASRTVSVTLSDGDGGSSGASIVTVGVTGVDDPAVARDDALATTEDTVINGASSVFSDHGSGADSDVEGDAFSVIAVAGGTVGAQFALPSGALLTINASGAFTYNPNGAFNHLPGPASGASNTTATDTFTYTITGGDTATATVTLTGVDSTGDVLNGTGGPDVLRGGIGADSMAGGAGSDFYFVDGAGDAVTEGAGQGTLDRVFANGDYTLTDGAEIELFSTDYHAGTAPIALTGNALGNLIYGNAGDNTLNGLDGADTLVGVGGNDTLNGGGQNDTLIGGADDDNLNGEGGDDTLRGGSGTDTLSGGTGNDWYVVDDANATLVEAAGQGTLDRVFASVSYALTAGAEIEITTNDHGGTGSINLTGNELDNPIYGNAGANVLSGKGGNDTLVGFGGADTFSFDTALNAASNVDRIVDFAIGVDRIRLDSTVFSALSPGDPLAPEAFVIGSAAGAADDRIIFDAATGGLFYDADGDAMAVSAVRFATLATGLALANTDFFVV